MPKISVIVPIYKVEKYLSRCVDSVLNQTFTYFECILVDDGSPDNCGKICDEYAKKDERVKVIHKKNGGLSDARNAGIDVAKGEYLGFVDSDDWIHPQMLEILYNGIARNNVLLSVCAYEQVKEEKTFKKIENPIFEIRNGMDFLIKDNVTAVIAPNKLYHKSLFNDIHYPVGKLHEDEFTTYKILYKAGEIAFCSEKLYMYFVNMEGITKGNYSPNRMSWIEALEERDEFLKEHRLYECRKWCKRQLLQGYQLHYYSTRKFGFKKYEKTLSRKMRRVLLFEAKSIDVNFKQYPWFYEVGFPHITHAIYLIRIFNEKRKDAGMRYCIRKAFAYILRR